MSTGYEKLALAKMKRMLLDSLSSNPILREEGQLFFKEITDELEYWCALANLSPTKVIVKVREIHNNPQDWKIITNILSVPDGLYD